MEFTVENICKAVLQFYSDFSLQKEIHHWLMRAQVSREAWIFSWELLVPEVSVEAQFFGASCLHAKISRYWHEVPQPEYNDLREKLFGKIILFSDGARIVRTQLSITIAALALQTVPDYWTNPIKELITMFQQGCIPQLTSEAQCNLLLELLTVIPEEYSAMHIEKPRKSSVHHELYNNVESVTNLLSSVLNITTPDQVLQQALRCLSSWVEFGLELGQAEPIVNQVFLLIQDTVMDGVIDTLVSIFSNAVSDRYPKTILRLLPRILHLRTLYEKALNDLDMDICHEICRLVVAVAENHCNVLVNGCLGDDLGVNSDSLALMQFVLLCTSVPGYYPVDEMCSEVTFTFWYTLQDEALLLDFDQYGKIRPFVVHLYYQLIDVLLVKVQYPDDDVYDLWTAGEKEQFRCYRQDIGDTLMYTFNILQEPVLGHVCYKLLAIKDRLEVESPRWQDIEAVYFFFGSVMESVDPCECVYLPSLLQLLPCIPVNNAKLASMALLMIGSLGEWLNVHSSCLTYVIPILINGLYSMETATSASLALRDITREASDNLGPYSDNIITACKDVIEKGSIKTRECFRLMSVIGQVLSGLSHDQIMKYLQLILFYHLQQLSSCVNMEPSNAVKVTITNKLGMLSWLFGSLNFRCCDTGDDHSSKVVNSSPLKPVLCVVQEIFPTVQSLVTRWRNDPGITEVICEVFKRALFSLMDDFVPVAECVINLLIQMYKDIQHYSILDLSKQLIIMFYGNEQLNSYIVILYTSICDTTVCLLRNAQNVKEYTSNIEEFMLFQSQIIKKTKQLLFSPAVNLNEIFHVAVIGLSMKEQTTVQNSSAFLTLLINADIEVEQIRNVVSSRCPLLIETILRGVGGECPRRMVEDLSNVLSALAKQHPSELQHEMTRLMAIDHFPSSSVTDKDKMNFIKSFISHRGHKFKSKEVIKEFSLRCRGLLGTDYAAATADSSLH